MRRLQCLASAAIVTAAMRAPAQELPTYLGNHERTANSHASIDPRSMTKLWSLAGYDSARIVGDDVIARKWGSQSIVKCFDAQTGAEKWSYTGKSGIMGTPEVFGNYVAHASGGQGSTRLDIVRRDTGALVTSVGDLDATFSSPMAVDRGGGSFQIVLSMTNGFQTWRFDGSSLANEWFRAGGVGGFSTPAKIGGSALFTGPGQFYAMDLVSGAVNHFHDGGIEGGGGSPAVVDSLRNRIFQREMYDGGHLRSLSGFDYSSNNSISLAWRINTVDISGTPALLDDGDLLLQDGGRVLRINGATGAVKARSVNVSALSSQALVVSQGLVWVATSSDLLALDISSLQIAGSLPGSFSTVNRSERSFAGMSDKYFVTMSNTYSTDGLTVYAVPEPSGMFVLSGVAALGLRRRGKRVPSRLR